MRRELQNHLEQPERCFKLCPSSRAQALERISFISCWCLLAFQLCWAELWSGCMCPQHHGGFLFQPFRVPSIKLLSASHRSQHPEHLAGWLCWDLLRRCTCTSFEYFAGEMWDSPKYWSSAHVGVFWAGVWLHCLQNFIVKENVICRLLQHLEQKFETLKCLIWHTKLQSDCSRLLFFFLPKHSWKEKALFLAEILWANFKGKIHFFFSREF